MFATLLPYGCSDDSTGTNNNTNNDNINNNSVLCGNWLASIILPHR